MLPYWRKALRRRNSGRTPCLRMASQSRPQKAWWNLPSFAQNPQVALSCFALYNTELRQIFPRREHVMRNLAGPSFGCVRILFSRSGNNAKDDVYCLRARDRVASAACWSSHVLPYLGPEIIVVMQAAHSSAPNRFAKWPPPSVPWQERGQNCAVTGLVTQPELPQVKG